MTHSQYICPGETHPISRGVHFARLASFYPACRECPFREDAGGLPAPSVEHWRAATPPAARPSLFTSEGVRGRWLNELKRSGAAAAAAAFASLIWERAPVAATTNRPEQGRRPARPTVILAQDERPSSPDIARGVAGGLRRWGCQVIDVGTVSAPCFRFAVRHLEASGGILVTGSGGDPSTTGLDFAGPEGMPVSRAGRPTTWGPLGMRAASDSPSGSAARHQIHAPSPLDLAAIELRLSGTLSRPTRTSVAQRTFQASVPYEAGLRRHFHALRPLSVVCGIGSRPVRSTLANLFATLPCRLNAVDVPVRVRALDDPRDADVLKIGEAVRGTQSALGMLIDDDGQRCAFLDEQGELLTWEATAALLIGRVLEDHPRSAVVVEPGSEPLRRAGRHHSAPIVEAGGTLASVCAAMQESAAVFGGGASARFWLRDERPVCDAAVTLGKMLDALSQGDRPLSELARG